MLSKKFEFFLVAPLLCLLGGCPPIKPESRCLRNCPRDAPCVDGEKVVSPDCQITLKVLPYWKNVTRRPRNVELMLENSAHKGLLLLSHLKQKQLNGRMVKLRYIRDMRRLGSKRIEPLRKVKINGVSMYTYAFRRIMERLNDRDWHIRKAYFRWGSDVYCLWVVHTTWGEGYHRIFAAHDLFLQNMKFNFKPPPK